MTLATPQFLGQGEIQCLHPHLQGDQPPGMSIAPPLKARYDIYILIDLNTDDCRSSKDSE